MAHWFVEHSPEGWTVRNGRRRVRTETEQDAATDYVLGVMKPSDTATLVERDGYRSPLKGRRKRRHRM